MFVTRFELKKQIETCSHYGHDLQASVLETVYYHAWQEGYAHSIYHLSVHQKYAF